MRVKFDPVLDIALLIGIALIIAMVLHFNGVVP